MLLSPRILAAALACAIAGVANACSASASPGEQLGAGPVSQALAGTVSLEPEPLGVTATDPAWLPRLRQRNLVFGWQSTLARYRFEGPQSSGALHDATRELVLGMAAPLELYPGAPPIAVGLAAFVPRGLITRARARFAEEPQAPLLLDRLQTLNLDAGVGMNLARSWSAGIGISALASFTGSIAVTADPDGAVRTSVEDDLLVASAPAGGIVYAPPAFDAGEIALSLAARGALESRVDLTLEPLELGGVALPELRIAGTVQYDPARIQVEAAFRRAPLGVVVAATYKRWSALDGFLATTVECPEAEPVCGSSPPAALHASDTVVPRLAASVLVSERPRLVLRAGYSFEASPLPEQRDTANYWDNERHVFGLGSGVALRIAGQAVRWDIAVQYHALIERRHDKSEAVPADNAGAPFVQTRGRLVHAAFAWSLEF